VRPKFFLPGLVLLLFFASCEKKVENESQQLKNEHIKLVDTDYFGCFDEAFLKDYPVSDTMFYNVVDDTLMLNVVMNQNCAARHTDSVVTNKDTASIYIQNNSMDIANCICDYRFQYHFAGFGEQVHFEVFYKPFEEADFTLWGELEYP
jgi:hypothetical protein